MTLIRLQNILNMQHPAASRVFLVPREEEKGQVYILARTDTVFLDGGQSNNSVADSSIVHNLISVIILLRVLKSMD